MKLGELLLKQVLWSAQSNGNDLAYLTTHEDQVSLALIETAKLNRVDPQARLIWALAQIFNLKMTRLDELLPWGYAA